MATQEALKQATWCTLPNTSLKHLSELQDTSTTLTVE